MINLPFCNYSLSHFLIVIPCFLKVLKLQACKYLTDSSLEPLYKGALPALQELDLSYGTLCQSAIEELLSCCRHLTRVSLNGCANMHDLNWGCSRGHIAELPGVNVLSIATSHENVHKLSEQPTRLLQNLNCVGCPNILFHPSLDISRSFGNTLNKFKSIVCARACICSCVFVQFFFYVWAMIFNLNKYNVRESDNFAIDFVDTVLHTYSDG